MTLVDLSARMLEASRRLNPECAQVRGDMRTVRLGRMFDAEFVHDAIVYPTRQRAAQRVAGALAQGAAGPCHDDRGSR